MRSVGVVTVGRSDYGIYRPLLDEIQEDPDLDLQLIVGGTHLSPEFGEDVEAIEEDGFEVHARVETTMSSDTPQAVAKSMGVGINGFAQVYAEDPPDVLVVLGDRYEMFAATAAAMPFNVPTAHIHGGEATHGLIDEAIRHSITKMSHLHFVATDTYRDRVVQMGEQPWRVVVSGAPSLDNLRNMDLPGLDKVGEEYGFDLDERPLVVTYHPETLSYEKTQNHVDNLVEALRGTDRPIVMTEPNADTEGRTVARTLEDLAWDRPQTWMVDNLGTRYYFGLMSEAAAMVGNSSSGIIEAASFGLPVVDVGDRQAGRVRGRNVISTDSTTDAIEKGIEKALEREFRASLSGMENPYGDGLAAPRIVERLRKAELGKDLLIKRFHDQTVEGST